MGATALAFQALTVSRTGAVRFATGDEIDLDALLWTIQPGRASSKIPPNGEPHRAPLTDDMMALPINLSRMGDLLFSSPRGGVLSDATLGKVMRSMHEVNLRGQSGHQNKSASCATWAAKLFSRVGIGAHRILRRYGRNRAGPYGGEQG